MTAKKTAEQWLKELRADVKDLRDELRVLRGVMQEQHDVVVDEELPKLRAFIEELHTVKAPARS